MTGDVKISKDGGTAANVSSLPTAVDATNMPGVFSWSPTAAEAGADVLLISGPVALTAPQGVKRILVESAGEMQEAVMVPD